MNLTERVRVRTTEILADGWSVLTRSVFEYRRNDGTWQTQIRESYDRGNGAAILLYDPERQTVLLVRQFRFPAFINGCRDLLIEVAAGVLDEASPEDRIRAEAEEETGYRVRDLRKVFEAYMSPGSVTEKLHFFIGHYSPADRVGAGGGNPEEGEDIEVLELRLEEALAMIGSGAIQDGKTIMLLQHAALSLTRAGTGP